LVNDTDGADLVSVTFDSEIGEPVGAADGGVGAADDGAGEAAGVGAGGSDGADGSGRFV
jgi:hypothetical protein